MFTDLKVYVLITPNKSRLINGKPKDYPSILPDPEIFTGVSPATLSEPMPDWYNKKRFSLGTWCCAKSKLNLFKYHYEHYPNSDIMFIEDDAVFNKRFNEMYSTFIKHVPEDWGMIFFGGLHFATAKRVNEYVLRTTNIVNNECFVVKAKYVPDIIDILDFNKHKKVRASDQAIASLMRQIPTYTPLVRFAGQRTVTSNIRNKLRVGTGSFATKKVPTYIDLDGVKRRSTHKEALLYLLDYAKTATVSVPVYGGIGNALFLIALGNWLKTFGVNVRFTNKIKHGNQTLSFIKDFIDTPLCKSNFGIAFKHIGKYSAFYQGLISGKVCNIAFYPELRNYISFNNIELKPIIGINVRRGEFLSSKYKNKKPDFYDLCERRYYHNAAKIAKKLGLPVRIISDEPNKIPKEIIDLFDNPEIMHGTFKEDFYNLAECKYKFISNSTFAYWAAYAAPDATVFYPKGCRDDIKLDEWIPLELTDMSDEELDKITPKEEKSE